MLSKIGEIRRDESCLDYAGSDVILYPCHGSKGNQYWSYDPHVSAPRVRSFIVHARRRRRNRSFNFAQKRGRSLTVSAAFYTFLFISVLVRVSLSSYETVEKCSREYKRPIMVPVRFLFYVKIQFCVYREYVR